MRKQVALAQRSGSSTLKVCREVVNLLLIVIRYCASFQAQTCLVTQQTASFDEVCSFP